MRAGAGGRGSSQRRQIRRGSRPGDTREDIGRSHSFYGSYDAAVERENNNRRPSTDGNERSRAECAHPVKVLLGRSKVNLVDVGGVGKPSVFQNDESVSHELANKIEAHLIGNEPQPEVMLD